MVAHFIAVQVTVYHIYSDDHLMDGWIALINRYFSIFSCLVDVEKSREKDGISVG